jgi:hypothetical protein
MKLLPIFQQILSEKLLQRNVAPRLEKIEFSRLAKVSKGLWRSYRMPKGKFYRHCLYSTFYQTLRDHGALFADLEPVVLQWGDYLALKGKFHPSRLYSTLWQAIKDHGALSAFPGPAVLQWAERKEASGKKVIYAEHGWLPRTTYQLSSKGCNSRSHVKFEVDKDYIRMLGGYETLQRLKRNLRMSVPGAHACNAQLVEQPFFLAALQTKTGNNLERLYSGTPSAGYYRQDQAAPRLGQAVIDHIESISSPCRIIFTQHPVDRDRRRFKVRAENRVVYAGQGAHTIDLLRHDNCCGVIAIDSNILHEALLWEKPALSLGEMLAVQTTESPFSGDLQSFLDQEEQRKNGSAHGDQYLAMLLAYQWTLTDVQNPLILREILRNVDVLVPWNVRQEYGVSA